MRRLWGRRQGFAAEHRPRPANPTITTLSFWPRSRRGLHFAASTVAAFLPFEHSPSLLFDAPSVLRTNPAKHLCRGEDSR